jgi:hypothetical protein
MNHSFRTANAALIAGILASASAPAYHQGQSLSHGAITTANASLFVEGHFSEPMTNYATGWTDPAGYDAASEFLAPSVDAGSELYEHIVYDNAEAFLSDSSFDDLRAINADFKVVDYTEAKTRREIPNRGLRMVLDWDRIKNKANWQQVYTSRLLQRLQRNAFRRKYALALAASTSVAITWGTTQDPDIDIANQAAISGDASGITPNRALWGLQAKLLRLTCCGAQNNAAGFGGRSMTAEEASQKAGLQALVDESRYQAGATKARIVGSKVLLFNAMGPSGEDPSNFKSARGTTMQGGRYAVYIRQISVKQWEIVVETYETEFVATTLGARVLNIS